jgi:hypothetical protein
VLSVNNRGQALSEKLGTQITAETRVRVRFSSLIADKTYE